MNKLRKKLCLLLSVSVLLCMNNISVMAAEIQNSDSAKSQTENVAPDELSGFDEKAHGEIMEEGICGENAQYKLYKDETLYIYGSGTVIGKTNLNSIFSEKYVSFVYVEDGITGIGEGAFNLCKDLKMVRLPDGVKEIGYIAFAYCDSLKTINLPESIEDIGKSVFFSCDNLEGEINIPKGIVAIRENTFGWCKKLKSVNLPMGLKTIEKSAFCGAGVVEIILPEGLETIGESSFSCSELNSIIITETVTLIEREAFSNCLHMEKALIPDSVTKIRSMAFKNCGVSYGKTFVIYCNEESEAERYAKENDIPYKPISKWGEPEIINTFNGCKGSPVKLSMTCKESDEFTFECADNCGMQSKYTGYASVQAGGDVSYSKNYELIFDKSGMHIISTYKNGDLLENDKIVIADEHTWDSGKIDKKATCTENGKIKYTCSYCKNTKTENIPATGHDYTKWKVTSNPDCVSG